MSDRRKDVGTALAHDFAIPAIGAIVRRKSTAWWWNWRSLVVAFTLCAAAASGAATDLRELFKRVPVPDLTAAVSGAIDKLTDAIAGSEFAMEGDKRAAKNGAGLALTADEQRRANSAAALFQKVAAQSPSRPPPVLMWRSGTAQAATLESGLDAILRKYQGAGTLTAAQQAEIRQALHPFALGYLYEQAEKAGLGPLVVAPNAITQYETAAYCNDPGTAGPKAGEEFQLKPLTTLYPPELVPTYLGLLKQGAAAGAHDSSIQGLIWAIRRTVNGQALGQDLSLSFEQQTLLRQADPSSIDLLLNYYAKARGDQLRRDAIKKGLNQVAGKANRVLSQANHSSALAEVQRLSNALDAMPVTGGTKSANSAFTPFGKSIVIQSTSRGGHKTASLAIANNSASPKIFLATTCVAQSTRNVQRLSIQKVWQQKAAQTDSTEFIAHYSISPQLIKVAAGGVDQDPMFLCKISPAACFSTGGVYFLSNLWSSLLKEVPVSCADSDSNNDSASEHQLFRVVTQTELNDIKASKIFNSGPNRFPKQFWTSLADAKKYFQEGKKYSLDPYTAIVSVRVSERTLEVGEEGWESFIPRVRYLTYYPDGTLEMLNIDAQQNGITIEE